ncbi:MAG: VanZ family protein [Bacteroidetes bacterium]|nr:VanZ family protein [Bacteroidota bacterium]
MKIWKAAYIFCLLSIIILSVLPSSRESIGHLDKFLHAFVYFTISVLAIKAFNWSFAQVFLINFSLSVLLEVVQYFIPSRDFSFLDMVANAAGIILAFYLWRNWLMKAIDRLLPF